MFLETEEKFKSPLKLSENTDQNIQQFGTTVWYDVARIQKNLPDPPNPSKWHLEIHNFFR